jgi:hypothetical protein
MTPEQFYEELLGQINVSKPEMDAAREKRDELLGSALAVARRHVGPARGFPAGALAAGTQIRPLNDVDTVLEFATVPETWLARPRKAMEDFVGWLDRELDGRLDISTHAIKVSYGDEEFTADMVIARKADVGILLPECPEQGLHRWIPSHPERHAQQVRERNAEWGSARFSRELRVLKHLNREWMLRDPFERKPLSSFHLTALGLAALLEPGTHAELTPLFLERAAELVLGPLPDPAGVGDPLQAKDPRYAAELLSAVAEKTRRALTAPTAEAERLLREVFGDPAERAAILGPGPVSVTAGALVGGDGDRAVRPVRSHGDRG